MDLPPLFIEQMQRLLADEATDFLAGYPGEARLGLRANTLKIDPQALRRRLPYTLAPVPWSPEGFLIVDAPLSAQPPGKHPDHAAGLFYLQEPAGMAAARALDPQPGQRILDLCAAPGGKATHLAALLGGTGWLLANEIHPTRVWELAENLERCGVRNATLTQETPQRLADRLGDFFDCILVDAPCSGEGMFRKSEAARRDWSPGSVQSCALRQQGILDAAVRMLRPGGRLVYATCTFNASENEAVIASLLKRRPDFELLTVQPQPGFMQGRPDWLPGGAGDMPDANDLARAVRLWPHRSPSEGHFIAVLMRSAEDVIERPVRRSGKKAAPLNQRSSSQQTRAVSAFQEFCRSHLNGEPQTGLASHLSLVGTRLYAIPDQTPELTGLKVIHPGWQLGDLVENRRGELRFEPAHALALGLGASQAARRLDFPPDDPEIRAYLRGETMPSPGEDGWVLVCVDGFPLGWGKRSQGTLKNSYPHGLRRT